MKIVHAPVNIAGQPILAVRELRRLGIDASLLEYGSGHLFGYTSDKLVTLRGRHRLVAQVETLRDALNEGYDVVHLWMAPLLVSAGYDYLHGLDLPFLKAHGKKIVYQGTGFDVRTRSLHSEVNPYNLYQYGFEGLVPEERHREYVAYLRDYVDLFIALDPEMHEFMPQARVVPRAIDLDEWPEVGIEKSDRPLVVHAPSKPQFKGTPFVLAALDELRAEGLSFDVKLVQGMAHQEALEWYKRADVIVDQLLIGWYGVLTMEALALGKPVVVYVRDDLLRAHRPEIPIQNANPDTVKRALREVISDFELRRSLAERGRAYVEEVHDVRTVAAKLKAVYEEVLTTPSRRPETCADVDWFLEDCRDIAARERTLTQRARAIRRKAEAYPDLQRDLPELRRKARAYEAFEARLAEQRERYEQAIERLSETLTAEREANAQRRRVQADNVGRLKEALVAEREANERRRQIDAENIARLADTLTAEREANAQRRAIDGENIARLSEALRAERAANARRRAIDAENIARLSEALRAERAANARRRGIDAANIAKLKDAVANERAPTAARRDGEESLERGRPPR